MGREIRRVPLDFDWPLNKTWEGFLRPDTLREIGCPDCAGSGYSEQAQHLKNRWYGYAEFDPAETGSTPFTPDTPEIRAFAERQIANAPGYYGTGEAAILREAIRMCALVNGKWSYHLHQDDVDALIAAGRLMDLTHTWTKGEGWQPIEPPPALTAEQVNRRSILHMHDGLNSATVITAACKRMGIDELCPRCEGHGDLESYPGQRADAEAWEPTDPPAGEGWQLWETVSEGSPISPVFPTDEALAAWIADPEANPRDWMPQEAALKFVREGWAPSFIMTPQTGFVSGAEYVGWHSDTN